MDCCVRDVMTADVCTIPETATLRDAIRMMSEKNVSSLIVVCKGERQFGIITRKDAINQLVIKEGNADIQLSKVMTALLISVEPDLRVKDAAMRMELYKVRRLPVLKEGKLAGIISTSDVFRHLIKSL